MSKRNITVKEKELIDKLNNRGASSAEPTKTLEKMKAESAAMIPSAPYSMNEDTRVRTLNEERKNINLTLKEKDGSIHYLSLLQLGNLISSIIDAKTQTKHHCACGHDHEAPKAEGKEQVNHPDHYNDYDVEVIEMMERVFGHEAVVNFCRLNAFKYRMRAGHKDGNSLEQDLKKERWYLNYIREHEQAPLIAGAPGTDD